MANLLVANYSARQLRTPELPRTLYTVCLAGAASFCAARPHVGGRTYLAYLAAADFGALVLLPWPGSSGLVTSSTSSANFFWSLRTCSANL